MVGRVETTNQWVLVSITMIHWEKRVPWSSLHARSPSSCGSRWKHLCLRCRRCNGSIAVHCGATWSQRVRSPSQRIEKKHRKIREHIGNTMDIFEVIGGWAGKIIEINSGTWPLYTWFLMDLAIKKDVFFFFHSKDLAMESISAGGSRGTWPWKSAEIWGDGNGLKLKTIRKNWEFRKTKLLFR